MVTDILKDIAAKHLDIITEFPQCSSYGYRCPQAGGMPATRYIPIRPDTPNLFRRVCENCYYDYEFEGIYTYSYTDEKLWIENKLNWRDK